MHPAYEKSYLNIRFTMTINLNTPYLRGEIHKLSIYNENKFECNLYEEKGA